MILTVPNQTQIKPMSQDAIAKVNALQALMLKTEQEEIKTQHVIHGGIYARTIMLPKDMILTGALIKIPTVLTIYGDATVFTGESSIRLVGYQVIAASAGRKQVFRAHEDTYITMSFPTDAKTVEEAEKQFTDEWELLLSHRQPENELTIITGE